MFPWFISCFLDVDSSESVSLQLKSKDKESSQGMVTLGDLQLLIDCVLVPLNLGSR